jgi:hypothetical protein
MNIIKFINTPIHYNLFPFDDNNRDINIYKYNDCILNGLSLFYPNVLIHSNNQYILPVNEKTMSLNFTTAYEQNNMTYNIPNNNINKVYNSPVFFFVYNTDNYFHFVYDTLPYLISFFHLKKNHPDLKLLINYPNNQKNNLYQYIIEFYELLNVDYIVCCSETKYKTIYVSTSYTHDGKSNLPPRKEIYDFFQNMSIKSNVVNKNIYISRRNIQINKNNIGTNYTNKRKLMNESDLISKLTDYDEIFTEDLSIKDKINLFSQSKNIVGCIGGGLVNILFSPPQTNLFCIVSPNFFKPNERVKFCFKNINIFYFYNTYHHSIIDSFSLFMRVKIIDKNNKYYNLIGEIVDIIDNNLLLNMGDGTNTGWNNDNKYEKILIDYNSVSKCDEGLNSPFLLDVDEFIKFLNQK